jgi:DNA-binding transcriptional LysR family regulator
MFIRQLEYLVTLAREKHFARAAEACHVSQPALSSAIRTLEAELGLVIVERTRRFVGFTEDGERVLGWARQTLASLQNMRQDASAAQVNLIGTLPHRRDSNRHAGDRQHACAVHARASAYALRGPLAQF